MWPKKFRKAGEKLGRAVGGGYVNPNTQSQQTIPVFDVSDDEEISSIPSVSSGPSNPFFDLGSEEPDPVTLTPTGSSQFLLAPDFLEQLASISSVSDTCSTPLPSMASGEDVSRTSSLPLSMPPAPAPPAHKGSAGSPNPPSTPLSSSLSASHTSSQGSVAAAAVIKPVLPLDEMLVDSPASRERIKGIHDGVEHLSSRLRRIIKSSRKLQSSGQAYAADIREFSQHVGSFLEKETDVPDDDVYKKAVGRFSAVLQDSEQLLQMQASKLDQVFTIPLDAMLRNHIASLKEQFKKHEKVKASYDACLHRWSHLKAKDVAKIEECRTDLANLSRQYNQVTLELATAINKFEAHKTITVLDRFAQMIFNQALFFRHGNQLFSDMDPFLSDVMGHIQQFKTQFTQAEQHPHRADDASSGNLAGGSASGKDLSSALTTIEGYLFKKGKNVVQPWQRRYFSISNGFFIAYKTGGDRKEVRPVPVINLLLCTVKMVPDPDRRFCFELVSPTCSYQLQAQSQEELMTWITVIQNAIQSALDQGHSAKGTSITAGTSASPREFAARVSAFTPSCATCADCREANPVWASINLGITICIECSGIHRSLGVHISKVRSLTLDDWADPVLGVLMTVGNERSNEVYEARYGQPDLPADAPVKPSPKSDRPLRERFIRAKYGERYFVPKLSLTPASLTSRLLAAIKEGDVSMVTLLIGQGADLKARSIDTMQSPLHAAVAHGSIILCEYLFQNGARLNDPDPRLRTPLHDAVIHASTRLCAWLFEKGADLSLKNDAGQAPVDLAVAIQAADVVTLLRLASLQAAEEQEQRGLPAHQSDTSINQFICSLLGKLPTAEEDATLLLNPLPPPSPRDIHHHGARASRAQSMRREAINLGHKDLFPTLKPDP